MSEAEWTRWRDVAWERLSDRLDRRMVCGDKIMVTQIRLKKGCIVPLHQHENEQFSYVLKGRLRFWLGSEKGDDVAVGEEEVIFLPSNLPHKVEALEDSLTIDIFSPPRQDWLTGQDDYLRG